MKTFIQKHKDKWSKDRASKLSKQPGQSPAPEPKALVEAIAEAVGPDKTVLIEQSVLGETIKVDVQSLKTAYPDHPARNEATPPYLDKYREYCAEAFERGDTETHDPILVQCAIWAINCADWMFAIDLVKHAKGMQSGMARSLPELLADMVLQDERTTDDALKEVVELVDSGELVVNHPLAAKLYKWAAHHFEESDLELATRFAVKAHKTYGNVGVKKFKETLEARLEKLGQQ